MNDVNTRYAGPDLGQMLPRTREIGPAKSWTEACEQARAEWDAPYGPAEQWDLRVEDRQAPGPHGPVPVRIYTPTAPVDAPRPVLVWCHGGAFMHGDLDMPEGDRKSVVEGKRIDSVGD